MHNLHIALIIGITAGIIDAVPMFMQKMDRYACISAFAHWVVMGLIIPFTDWSMQPWLKGLLIGELSVIPIMVLVIPKEPKSLIPISMFSALLGMGVGVAGAVFIR